MGKEEGISRKDYTLGEVDKIRLVTVTKIVGEDYEKDYFYLMEKISTGPNGQRTEKFILEQDDLRGVRRSITVENGHLTQIEGFGKGLSKIFNILTATEMLEAFNVSNFQHIKNFVLD